jgi:hypothetical protein
LDDVPIGLRPRSHEPFQGPLQGTGRSCSGSVVHASSTATPWSGSCTGPGGPRRARPTASSPRRRCGARCSALGPPHRQIPGSARLRELAQTLLRKASSSGIEMGGRRPGPPPRPAPANPPPLPSVAPRACSRAPNTARAVRAGVGIDLRPVEADRAHLQHAHLAREQQQHMGEQPLDLLEKAPPKRGDRVVVGVAPKLLVPARRPSARTNGKILAKISVVGVSPTRC